MEKISKTRQCCIKKIWISIGGVSFTRKYVTNTLSCLLQISVDSVKVTGLA